MEFDKQPIIIFGCLYDKATGFEIPSDSRSEFVIIQSCRSEVELERQPKYSVSTTQVNLAIKYTYANFKAAESSSVIVGKNKSYRILTYDSSKSRIPATPAIECRKLNRIIRRRQYSIAVECNLVKVYAGSNPAVVRV